MSVFESVTQYHILGRERRGFQSTSGRLVCNGQSDAQRDEVECSECHTMPMLIMPMLINIDTCNPLRFTGAAVHIIVQACAPPSWMSD